jgi:hypothetical protein
MTSDASLVRDGHGARCTTAHLRNRKALLSADEVTTASLSMEAAAVAPLVSAQPTEAREISVSLNTQNLQQTLPPQHSSCADATIASLFLAVGG